MAPGPLPDIVEGSAAAAVTIIEYASMTCSHCAAFHEETWPGLKAKYVDTGKVKFILREFPLDPLATAAFMLARCAGPDKRDALIDRLFAPATTWAFGDEPRRGASRAWSSRRACRRPTSIACLNDQALYDPVNQTPRARGRALRRQFRRRRSSSTADKLTRRTARSPDFDQALAAAVEIAPVSHRISRTAGLDRAAALWRLPAIARIRVGNRLRAAEGRAPGPTRRIDARGRGP